MNPITVKLEDGGWTPALHQIAIEVIDSLINRPASALISDPKEHQITFQSVREKLSKKKYSTIEEWGNEIRLIFKKAKDTKEDLSIDVAEEFEIKFERKYQQIVELSHFKFKTATKRIVEDIDDLKEKYKDLE
ncbi:hypothetical protein TVAG_515910 [Trichomonas vaginalis G3]|uniref:Bromo domain-containing protein n=1 Tax=Trichomonas vaginalis (strain ATCC PRA-98 / G3) TaxID=412133 RepID=A2GEV6_TRIV3|nr:hypothetical protein TVAGG3_0060800 [Trichomonas vaginalis G3]EAX84310.1 hypothetical protein TVAG_515910 [Trichomonas vaginalis G3]KAI5541991.1 hypothetical protein TVAGG3_0060800 [Trichomonas vaginalis G3]|eukprot:XP_001297240.1 hypothetical protein [Trichomonas vaginalis G3]